jgi:hypothetical protein
MQKCDFLARGFNLGKLLRQTISMERRSFLSSENSQIRSLLPIRRRSAAVASGVPIGLDRDWRQKVTASRGVFSMHRLRASLMCRYA